MYAVIIRKNVPYFRATFSHIRSYIRTLCLTPTHFGVPPSYMYCVEAQAHAYIDRSDR